MKFTIKIIGLAIIANIAFVQCSKSHIEKPKDDDKSKISTCLFPVGGGTISDNLLGEFLKYSPKKEPRVLIISHAYAGTPSTMQAQITRFTNQFKDLGIKNVEALDLSNAQGALEQINNADVIWMSGGLQNTLRNTLNNADQRLIPAIKTRYDQGQAIVGGTSAGAAIMSQTMIGGNGGNSASSPGNVSISNGFGLWPEVIIDQHFTERNRKWRLINAVSRHPQLIGIGIDESTGVLYINKNEIKVVGSGKVTILYQKESAQQEVILKSGDTYKLNNL